MFGFGEKAKLKQLGEELKGASLQEVVERFANKELIEYPSIPYDKEIALIYKNNISAKERQDVGLLNSKIKKISKKHKLQEGSVAIYLAYHTSHALQDYALDLTLATKGLPSIEEAVSYLFDTWLETPPDYYILPILFPAKSGRRIEDFSINRDVRYAMIDGLFARLQNVAAFKGVVNEFAEEHSYFRAYPLYF